MKKLITGIVASSASHRLVVSRPQPGIINLGKFCVCENIEIMLTEGSSITATQHSTEGLLFEVNGYFRCDSLFLEGGFPE